VLDVGCGVARKKTWREGRVPQPPTQGHVISVYVTDIAASARILDLDRWLRRSCGKRPRCNAGHAGEIQ
jgi:hypothetical protein